MPFLAVWTLLVPLAAGEIPLSPDVTPPPLVRAETTLPLTSDAPSISHIALLVDVAVPSGLGASLVVRPWSWISVHGGYVTNTVSPGIRGGITLSPVHFALAPTFTCEVGHFWDGDANSTIAFVTQNSSFHSDLVTHFGYNFVSGQLGLEIGPPDWWVVSIRVGMSYLWTSSAFQPIVAQVAHDLGESTGGLVNPVGSQGMYFPSAQIGLKLYVF